MIIEPCLNLRQQTHNARIAGSDEHVANKPVAARALDCGAAEAGAKAGIIDTEQLVERWVVALASRCKLCLMCGLGKFVPGTDRETIVAAIDAVPHRLAKL